MKNLSLANPFVILLIVAFLGSCKQEEINDVRLKLDLSGVWNMKLDPQNKGVDEKWFAKEFDSMVKLPGTLDENKKGYENTDTTKNHLNRPYIYTGAAWYQKTIQIPEKWNNKVIRLIMERTKVSQVWIDEIYLGSQNNVYTKQIYYLPKNIKPGEHTLTILIDNRIELVPVEGSHAYEDNTQTNWNGIIGSFELEALSQTFFSNIQVYPNLENKKAEVVMHIKSLNEQDKDIIISMNAHSWNSEKEHTIKRQKNKFEIHSIDTILHFTLNLGENVLLWSEYDPNLYHLNIQMQEKDVILDNQNFNIGFREFSQNGTQFTINGDITFLRGKNDACVFPLTGYPPTDTSEWNRVFKNRI